MGNRHINKRTMIVEMMWQFIFMVIDGACVGNRHINETTIIEMNVSTSSLHGQFTS